MTVVVFVGPTLVSFTARMEAINLFCYERRIFRIVNTMTQWRPFVFCGRPFRRSTLSLQILSFALWRNLSHRILHIRPHRRAESGCSKCSIDGVVGPPRISFSDRRQRIDIDQRYLES